MVKRHGETGEWSIDDRGLRRLLLIASLVGGLVTVTTAFATARFAIDSKAPRASLDSVAVNVAELKRGQAALLWLVCQDSARAGDSECAAPLRARPGR